MMKTINNRIDLYLIKERYLQAGICFAVVIIMYDSKFIAAMG